MSSKTSGQALALTFSGLAVGQVIGASSCPPRGALVAMRLHPMHQDRCARGRRLLAEHGFAYSCMHMCAWASGGGPSAVSILGGSIGPDSSQLGAALSCSGLRIQSGRTFRGAMGNRDAASSPRGARVAGERGPRAWQVPCTLPQLERAAAPPPLAGAHPAAGPAVIGAVASRVRGRRTRAHSST